MPADERRRAGRRTHRARVMSEPSTSARNVPMPAAAAHRQELEQAEQRGVGDHRRRRAGSASPGRAGRHSMRPPAREQEDRQQPAAGPEVRQDDGPRPVGERALRARERQHDERQRAEDEEHQPDQRAGDVRRDRGPRGMPRPPPLRRGGSRRAGARRREAIGSDLHDDREDHRPPLRLLVQVTRDGVLDLHLEQRDLADVVARVLDGRDDPLGRRLR